MKSKVVIRILVMCLIISVLLLQLAACAKESVENPTVQDITDSSDDNSKPEADVVDSEPQIRENLPEENYNGYDFTVLVFDNQIWSWAEIVAEEEIGEPINDAFYKRNRLVEEKFNINIKQVATGVDNVPTLFRKSVDAGDDAYDVAFMRQQAAANVATAGYCLDLNELEYVDFEKPWWDKNALRDLSFGNTNFIAASEITIGDKEAIWVVFFDKQTIADNAMESPYELVLSGKWTFDKMLEMMKSGMRDLDGDGTMTMNNDKFGLLTHGENFPALWIAGGCRLVENDSKNIPQIAFNNERFTNVWEKLVVLMADESCYDKDIGFISSGLANGETLFATEVVAFLRQYRENERDFGILPMPKYNEAQEEYQTYVALGTTLMVVGKSIPDTTRTSIILEALAAEGYRTILPAYYESSIKSKYTRDEDSIPMLDIAFNTRRYDLGLVFNWGKVSDRLRTSRANIASTVETHSEAMQTAMEKTFEVFDIY
jgi:ABC-type sugar transport system, periplasmic component